MEPTFIFHRQLLRQGIEIDPNLIGIIMIGQGRSRQPSRP